MITSKNECIFCFQGETYKISEGSSTGPSPRDGGELPIHLGMYAIKQMYLI